MYIRVFLRDFKYTKKIYSRLKNVKHKLDYINKTKAHYNYINRSKACKKLCIVLAGYKPFLYEDVFGRIRKYAPDDIDICIITSGLYSKVIDDMCSENGWSYLSTKENNVALVQNLAIDLHKHAEYI